MYRLTLLFAFLLLSGCQSTRVSKRDAVPAISPSAEFPALALYTPLPSKALFKECDEFDQASVMQHCRLNHLDASVYLDAFRKSRAFYQVDAMSRKLDYQLEISTALLNQESAADLSKAALSGASLLLIPMTTESQVKTELKFYWRGQHLESFAFSLPYVQKVSLFHKPKQAQQDFALALVEKFMTLAQEKSLFSYTYLNDKLDASDYAHQLRFPQQVSEFVLSEHVYFNNPLIGAALSYTHPDFSSDQLHVAIYPIRKAKWGESEEVLQQELMQVTKELQSARTEEAWEQLDISDSHSIEWQDNQISIKGLAQSAQYQKAGEEVAYVSSYVFVQEDKIIRIQANFPASFSDQLVRTLIPEIQVPEESAFMSSLRSKAQAQ